MLKPFHSNGVEGWPFNDLERLLQQAAGRGGQGVADGSAHTAFWNALLAGELHILGSVEGGRANLPSYGFPGGDALVAFTSRELLERSIAENVSFVTMPARTFFEMTAGARIALNPCGPYGKEFTPEEIGLSLTGVVMRGGGGGGAQLEVTRDTQVLLGQLAVEPVELIEAVAAICRDDSSINAVSLCAVSMPAGGESRPHPLLGIDARNYAAARNAVGAAAERWAKTSGLPVDIVDMNIEGTLQSHLRSHGRVLYKRKAGWLAGLFA
jgi:hypothetical protein